MKKLFFYYTFFSFFLFGEVGKPAPSAFILPNLKTNEFKLFREYISGNKVIVNFFASYCVPCKEEISEIQKLVLKYPNIKLILINVDEKSEQEKVEQLIVDWKIDSMVLLDPYQVALKQYLKPKLAIPATILINETGNIVFESIGYEKNTIGKIQKGLESL